MTAFRRRHHGAPVRGDEPLPTLYDLDAGHTVRHDLMFLCHQVLQNCVFEPWLSAGHRLTGVYVTSEHQHKIALYGVDLGALSSLFLSITSGTTYVNT